MVFGLFKRKDPICGMTEAKGKGLEYKGKWFCAEDCVKKYKGEMPAGKSCCSS